MKVLRADKAGTPGQLGSRLIGMVCLLALLMASVLHGCGDGGTSTTGQGSDAGGSEVGVFDAGERDAVDGGQEVSVDARLDDTAPDVVDAADAGFDSTDVADIRETDPTSEPDGASETDGASIGDPCGEPSDCLTGQCVTLAAGGPAVCASLCSTADDCIDNEDCVLLLSTGADGVQVCLATDFCLDQDGDEWGVGPACLGRDCNDEDPTVNPGVNEVCNGRDDDCDGTIDDAPIGQGERCDTGFQGICSDGVTQCENGNQVCEALQAASAEVCDGADNDCDGMVDEDPTNGIVWYRDADDDRFGTVDDTIEACAAPAGYVDVAGDCNDDVAAINPAAAEVCDGADNDCDGVVDAGDGVTLTTWYADVDEDGFGDPAATTVACEQPDGYVNTAGDCDDNDNTLPSGATRTFTLDTNLPVPPSGQPSGITVARVPVESAGIVQGVRVQVTILHSDTGDITITLISPEGTRVTLARERGFDDDYIQTTFSDAASAPISSSSNPFTGTWRPEQPLAVLIGETAGGDWLLEVSDRFALQNGSIRRVRIELESGCP